MTLPGTPGPEFQLAEAAAYDTAQAQNHSPVPAGAVARGSTSTWAHQGAPLARPTGGRLTVVLYSPGAGDPRGLGTVPACTCAGLSSPPSWSPRPCCTGRVLIEASPLPPSQAPFPSSEVNSAAAHVDGGDSSGR